MEVDEAKIKSLFELKLKEKDKESSQIIPRKVSILSVNRAQSIGILLKRLPPIDVIKKALLDFDSHVVSEEDIDKIIKIVEKTMDEEKAKLNDVKYENPDLQLDNAEQFLHDMLSVSDLTARLSLWKFKMGYAVAEKEVCEALCNLKNGIEEVLNSTTFRKLLASILAISNVLNNPKVKIKAFTLEFLTKVNSIKDTKHNRPLLHHLCEIISEKYPELSDLHSDFTAVHKASKCDFNAIQSSIKKLENTCKSSLEDVQVVNGDSKRTLTTFLQDTTKRIEKLMTINKRVINRFNSLLHYLGMTKNDAKSTKPHEFLQMLSSFSMEYRTVFRNQLELKQRQLITKKRESTRGLLTIGDNGKDHVTATQKECIKSDSGYVPGTKDTTDATDDNDNIDNLDDLLTSALKNMMGRPKRIRGRKKLKNLN